MVEVKTAVVRKGGHPGSVAFNFEEKGVLVFKGNNRDEVEEALILGDVDVLSVEQDEDLVVVYVSPSAFAQAKEVLSSLGISEYEEAEISMIPNEYITIDDEEVKGKFEDLIDTLDELEDVQNVYHNVDL